MFYFNQKSRDEAFKVLKARLKTEEMRGKNFLTVNASCSETGIIFGFTLSTSSTDDEIMETLIRVDQHFLEENLEIALKRNKKENAVENKI